MTKSVKTVTREVTLRELEAEFAQHDFNAFPVVDGQRMSGLVIKCDFLKAFAFSTGHLVPHDDDLRQRTAGDLMTEAVVHLAPAAPLPRALQVMVNLRAKSFPVLSQTNQLVGMLAREDSMRARKVSTRES